MADQVKNTTETLSHETQTPHSSQETRTFQEKTSNAPRPRFEAASDKAAEIIEAGESAEIAGEVSEALKSQSEQKGDATSGGKRPPQMTPAQIKALLLEKAPSQEVMLKEVKREIEKEIKYLHKRANKIVRKAGAVNAFELNNIVKKIRELRVLLLALAKATLDAVKTLWVRFVHGVM